jgi:O-antigen/teichoic acid export membrane protein
MVSMKAKIAAGAAKVKGAVPDGAASVGLGIAVASIAAYAFVVITLNSLDGGAKAAFSAFWAVIFVIGPGFFLPMEQEVGRAVAHRRAQGDGSRPLVFKAFKLGAALTAVLIVATVALSPLLSEEIYNGDQFFTVALAVSLVSFFLLHLSRGVLAGEGRFRPYAEIIAIDAIVRLAMVIGLVVAGVTSAGVFALCIGLAPLVALPLALRGQRQILQPGSDAPFGELSKNLGWLLAGSVFMQALAYSPLLGVNLLGGPEDEEIVAGFASAFFIARIPILAFGAIQGVLLPKLAGLAGSGQKDEFKSGLEKLLVLVVAIAIAGTVGAFVLGPTVGKILFNDFTMGASGLALLAAGSGVFIVALTLAQALMALGGHRTTAIAWGLGLIVAIICMSLIHGLELRVDLGFLLGGVLAVAVMFPAVVRRRSRMDDLGVGALVEAIEHEPIEI